MGQSLLDMMFEDASGVSAFQHPDQMDPNDHVRQRTQARSVDYPYDMPVMYGRSSHAGMDGSERQDGADNGPPLGRQHKAPLPKTVWEQINDSIDKMELEPVEIGPQGYNATRLGYGNHGRMGEDGMDAIELEVDALQRDFRDSYENAMPVTDEMEPHDLFGLLTQLDPDFAADTFAPEDEGEMRSIYGLWADRMSGLEG